MRHENHERREIITLKLDFYKFGNEIELDFHRFIHTISYFELENG